MFRCITELKGIAVDVDSFEEVSVEDWMEINNIIPCVFLTEKTETIKTLRLVFGFERTIELEIFDTFLSPNKKTHIKVLSSLGIKNTELAYLSHKHEFLVNANGFLSATIWVTKSISYQQASKAPDLICNSMDSLKRALKEKMVGFYGETVLFSQASSTPISRATMLPVDFKIGNENVVMYFLGRYFGYSHYMSQLHPYSTAIYYNKKPNKNYTGVFNDLFKDIYNAAIFALKDIHDIDCICSVPVKPGKESRFNEILDVVSETCNIINIEKNFSCKHNYPDQKQFSTEEREKNVKNVFCYKGDLTGKSVILIDDISSTGSTIKECIRELKKHGADKIIVVVLAINQFETGAYWSAEEPQVTCPTCGSKMVLLINKNGQFFFTCVQCYKKGVEENMSFCKGWKNLCELENAKFNN